MKLRDFFNRRKKVFDDRKSIEEKIIENGKIKEQKEQQQKSTNKEDEDNTRYNAFVGLLLPDNYSLPQKIDISKKISKRLRNGVFFEEEGIRICVDDTVDTEDLIETYNHIQTVNNIKKLENDFNEAIHDRKERLNVERTKASMAFELAKTFLIANSEIDIESNRKSHLDIVRDSCKIVNMIMERFDIDGTKDKEFMDMLNKFDK